MMASSSSSFLQRHLWSLSLALVSALCFAQLASELGEGELTPFDRAVGAVVAQWRGAVDGLMLQLTRLGNPAPVFAFTLVVLGLLLAYSRRREASYLALCATSALLLNMAMKALFHRARPGAETAYLLHMPSSFSFPSGHAMLSAVTYLTLGALAARVAPNRATGIYLLVLAVLATFLVGASRVYLGVHWPSDVLAGWCAGAAWAMLCWLVAQWVLSRRRALIWRIDSRS